VSKKRRRRFDPFGRRSMALSVALHVSLLGLVWASTLYDPWQMEFVTYEIELVSPPAAQQAEEPEPEPPAEELVVERPEPEPPEPEAEEVVPVEEEEPEPEPEPEREEPPAEEPPPDTTAEEVPATSPEPTEEAEETGEDINVRMEGLQRDYPAYYANIIGQINRCFRWREGGRWETVIFFYIDREGNAEDIQWMQRSGNTAFDIEAMGAVECAGGRFGPLPEDLPYDRFPVRFRFSPRGRELLTVPWTSWGGPQEI
jgi:outer membrane biosynthesis protein TonB